MNDQQGGCHAKSQTGNIDEGKNTILENIPDGKADIIDKHGLTGFI
jgi:hypothetical protein